MTIAAHFFATNQLPSYLYPIFLVIAKENPDEEFIFLTDKNVGQLSGLPGNCKVIPVNPALKNGLLMHYWYNFKLPSILKKHSVSALITETSVCCLRTNIPQCLLLKDITFLQKKKQFSNEYSFYIKKLFTRFIHKSASVLVAENFMMTKLVLKYPSLQQKISFAGHGLSGFYQPMQPGKREARLGEYTEGYEYFICDCSPVTLPHVVTVLKAYSIFKKRLKSNLRLILLLRDVTAEECVMDFKNYKYRHEVKFISHQSEDVTASLIAAAYAFIHLPTEVLTGTWGLNAMECGVPLLTFDNTDAKTLYGDAALYTLSNEKSLADNMMLLYKDETLRNEYIKKGNALAEGYNWPGAAHRAWQTILSISRD
jgi:glycosyltransferase involved in cell wall biosynthesis